MVESKKFIPVSVYFDTERIVIKSDAETFDWFRKNCYNAGALPTLQYHLHSRAGKLNEEDLIREKTYFLNQLEDFENRLNKVTEQFQELKNKTDSESQKKLVGIVESFSDYGEYVYRAKEIVEVFKNAIEENSQAAENFRKIKVGAKLKAARLAKGFSQEQVGQNIGVSKARVSDYEAGKTEPPIKTLLKLVKLLKLSLDELYEIRKEESA